LVDGRSPRCSRPTVGTLVGSCGSTEPNDDADRDIEPGRQTRRERGRVRGRARDPAAVGAGNVDVVDGDDDNGGPRCSGDPACADPFVPDDRGGGATDAARGAWSQRPDDGTSIYRAAETQDHDGHDHHDLGPVDHDDDQEHDDHDHDHDDHDDHDDTDPAADDRRDVRSPDHPAAVDRADADDGARR
jgi:hypothetical protein